MKDRSTRRRVLQHGALGISVLASQNLTAQVAAPTPTVTREALEAMMTGYQRSQMLHVAAKLKLADLLATGSRTTAELASATKTHEDSLYRLMRTLASLGVFTEEQGRRFSLNAAAEYLRSGVPGSLRVNAEIVGEEWMWGPWGNLLQSVTTGKTAFDLLYGKGTFEWFEEHPAAGALFDAGQAQTSASVAGAVTKGYDYSRFHRIIDLGGGDGTLLAAILRANPSAHGVLFDLPRVVNAARDKFDPSLIPRIEFVGGDFFKSVPADGDLYVMKVVLHDWTDADCQKILSTIRRAIPVSARLLVAEDLVCGPNQPCAAKPRDINMLVRTGGRNRTEQEYRDLLTKGRFRPANVYPTTSTLYLIESLPA